MLQAFCRLVVYFSLLIGFMTNIFGIIIKTFKAKTSPWVSMIFSKPLLPAQAFGIGVCIILINLLFSPSVSFASKRDALRIEIKIEKDHRVKAPISELTKNLEKIAKIYKTSNQKSYWESEGKGALHKFLRSRGYYSATVNSEISGKNTNSITFHIEPNERYSLSNIGIKFTTGSNLNIKIPAIADLKLKKGTPAIAEDIFSTQKEILEYVEEHNCLLSLSVSHQAVINHFDRKLELVFFIDAGSSAKIGEVSFQGLDKIHPDYARKLTKLKSDQCFKTSLIKAARGRLQKSGLFASTKPTIPKTTNKDGSVPVIFNIVERKSRSVLGGLSYGTDLGFGATLGWEHRNFLGQGELVRANLFGNEREQILELNYVKPFFKRDDQTLRLGLRLENKKSKAFEHKEGAVSAFLERKLSEYWIGGFGARFSHARVQKKSDNSKEKLSLLSLPLFFIKDTRDNILNSTRGYEVRLEGAPYFGVSSKQKPFFKTTISGAAYVKPSDSRLVTAFRGSIGSILGVRSASVPIAEKFYVGGGGSVRGYEHQMAGDLDSSKRPLGGRSFVEGSLELRFHFAEKMGLVAFFDGGRAYSAASPDFGKKLLYGAGVGFRYYTEFAPIRVDIAFPIKKRQGVDKSYQIYFGLGQSF
ncbi:MAG: hypothetical protein COA94_02195 [Rickettsiales bacterium]|nr:MAG: hypothetical protein COA94_02195 [Rickettsiales bacterium]